MFELPIDDLETYKGCRNSYYGTYLLYPLDDVVSPWAAAVGGARGKHLGQGDPREVALKILLEPGNKGI